MWQRPVKTSEKEWAKIQVPTAVPDLVQPDGLTAKRGGQADQMAQPLDVAALLHLATVEMPGIFDLGQTTRIGSEGGGVEGNWEVFVRALDGGVRSCRDGESFRNGPVGVSDPQREAGQCPV